MADENRRLTRTGDQETDEILGEIEREGGAADSEEEDSPESKEERPGEEKEEAAPESDDTSEEEGEDGGEPEDGEEEEVEPDLAAQRPSRRTSQAEERKAEYWRKKAQDLTKQVNDLAKKVSDVDLKDKLKEIAEKEKIPLDRLQIIVETVADAVRTKMTNPDLEKKIERSFEFAEREAENERQDTLFEQEFSEIVMPLLRGENPDITEEDIDEEFSKLYDEAFSPKPENDFNQRTGRPSRSLVQVHYDLKSDRPRRSGERSRVRSIDSTGQKPINEMSAEEIEELSDEQFDKLSDRAATNSPSLVRPKKVNTL